MESNLLSLSYRKQARYHQATEDPFLTSVIVVFEILDAFENTQF